MKIKYLIVIASAFLASCTPTSDKIREQGRPIKWMTNLEEAAAKANAEKKNLLVEFSTEWCPYCKRIEENIFNKAEAIERLGGFIPLHINGDKKENQELLDRFSIIGFPTFLIMTPDLKELIRFNDINSVPELLALLDKAEKSDSAGKEEENELSGRLNELSDDKNVEIRRAALELIEKFPNSIYLPVYYNKLALSYSSNALREAALKKAVEIFEGNLSNFKNLNGADRWIVLDQQIDLAADIYEGLNSFSKIEALYLQAAELGEDETASHGGIKRNLHLIGDITHFYLMAGAPDKAVRFLKKASTEASDYWPIYNNMAKALIAEKNADEAAPFAEKGYSLAEEVAKPRAAITWAECYAAKGDLSKAIEILNEAVSDLKKGSYTGHGRAAKMLAQLEERIGEYKFNLSTKQN